MFGIGMPELVIIFVIALLVFGPKELPKIGKTIGRAMGEFRRASDELKDGIQREIDMVEREQSEVSPSSEVSAPTVTAESPIETFGTSEPAPDPQLDLPMAQAPVTSTPQGETPPPESVAGKNTPPADPAAACADDAVTANASPLKTSASQATETKNG